MACNELDSDDVKDNPGITIITIIIPGSFLTGALEK